MSTAPTPQPERERKTLTIRPARSSVRKASRVAVDLHLRRKRSNLVRLQVFIGHQAVALNPLSRRGNLNEPTRTNRAICLIPRKVFAIETAALLCRHHDVAIRLKSTLLVV